MLSLQAEVAKSRLLPASQQWTAVHAFRCAGRRTRVSRRLAAVHEQDWRTERMQEITRHYFKELWSTGRLEACEELLDDQFVHRDHVWHPDRLVVGPAGMRTFLEATRTAYPDLWIEVDKMGMCDGQHLFVSWKGRGTNLGALGDHKPTRHESHMAGINLITFNDDRSKIREVDVYRQALHEDIEEVEEHAKAHNSLEIRLERLHFDRKPASSSLGRRA